MLLTVNCGASSTAAQFIPRNRWKLFYKNSANSLLGLFDQVFRQTFIEILPQDLFQPPTYA